MCEELHCALVAAVTVHWLAELSLWSARTILQNRKRIGQLPRSPTRFQVGHGGVEMSEQQPPVSFRARICVSLLSLICYDQR